MTDQNQNKPLVQGEIKHGETIREWNLELLEAQACNFLEAAQSGTKNPYRDNCLTEAERDKELRQLGMKLGFRYAKATLSNFVRYDKRISPVVERLTDLAMRMQDVLADGGGLVLYGPPGTGKDHLLAALLKIAIAKWRLSVEWRDGVGLHAEFRRVMDSDRETESGLLRRLTNVHILAISDPVPPAGELSNYQLSTLRDVIDRRYRQGKTFWMTTNLAQRERAEELLTDPIMQRIRERSGQIECNWPSWRERQQVTW